MSMSTSTVAAIPAGYHSVTPYLTVRGAAQAIDFYKKAFGAQELSRMPSPDGRLGHAEIKIGNSIVMLSDEFPEMGGKGGPQALGGSPVGMMLYVENVDKVFERAIAEGAVVKQPLTNMFWGDRFGRLVDPFGHEWSLAMHIEDVSPEEMARRAAKEMAPKPPAQN
jgi:PhnB protein